MPLNEAELIEKEIVFRNMRITEEVFETKRAMSRWLALTLGVINPGESRQSAVAVLDALLYFHFIKNSEPSVDDLSDYISKNWEAINEKTLRYHLLRMKKIGIIENSRGRFYLKSPSEGDKFNPYSWAVSIFDSDYRQVVDKIGKVLSELKNKA